jgi:glycosidase
MADFGTMDDFDTLLPEMKKRKLKLMMDLVVNHTSDEHSWFIESKKAKHNPYRDFYHWHSGHDGQPPTKWGACFGGSCWVSALEMKTTMIRYRIHTYLDLR